MNPEIFGEWLQRQGHQIIQTESSYWYDQGPRVYQAFPYHWEITPTEAELEKLLKETKGIALRYSTPVEASMGASSYHVHLDDLLYSLERLHKKARYDVRKGLASIKIEQISFDEMADKGWQLRFDTIRRQGREKAETNTWWKKLCHSCKDLPGFEAWAAVSNGQLAASLIGFIEGKTFSILYQQSRTEYLDMRPNNALTYQITLNVLSRPNIEGIFYGLHSLDAPPTVDQFKFRMGYTAKAVRQRVVFHPALDPFVGKGTHALLKGLRRALSGNATLAKAEGMVRFYREGKLPIKQQSAPLEDNS